MSPFSCSITLSGRTTHGRTAPGISLLPIALALCGSGAAYGGPLDDTFAATIGAFVLSVGPELVPPGAEPEVLPRHIEHVNVSNASYDGNLAWRYGGARLFFRASF